MSDANRTSSVRWGPLLPALRTSSTRVSRAGMATSVLYQLSQPLVPPTTPIGRVPTSPESVRTSASVSGVHRTASIASPADITGRRPSAVVQRAASRLATVPTTTAVVFVRMLAIVIGARLEPPEIVTQSPDGGGPEPPGDGEAGSPEARASVGAGVTDAPAEQRTGRPRRPRPGAEGDVAS